MSDIIIPDRPGLISDEETFIGRHVRSGTWQSLGDLCNWLNFYARKVQPYYRLGVTSVSPTTPPQFIYPVDAAPAMTRYLTVVCSVQQYTGTGEGKITLTSSTDDTGVEMARYTDGVTGSVSAKASELVMAYGVGHIEITAGQRELITLTPDADMLIDGFGAWELPVGMHREDGDASLITGKSVITSVAANVIDSRHFKAGNDMDTDVEDIHDALIQAEGNCRPILFFSGIAGNSGPMSWHTDSPNNTGSYVSLPHGGIPIPPTAVKKGATTRTVRVAIAARNNAAGNSSWRVNTSQGTYAGATIDQTTIRWYGSQSFGSPFDPTKDGVQATLGTDLEWINVDLREDSGTTAVPSITAIAVWDES